MRSPTRLLILAAASAAVLGAFSIPSHADCAAPTVTAPKTARPGETITVQGEYWTPECNDTCSVGCGGESCGEPARPAAGLRIAIKPAKGPESSEVQLAEGIVADDELRIEQNVIVPEYVQPGRYIILVGNQGGFGWYESGVIQVKGP
jgi:hypothetical protein